MVHSSSEFVSSKNSIWLDISRITRIIESHLSVINNSSIRWNIFVNQCWLRLIWWITDRPTVEKMAATATADDLLNRNFMKHSWYNVLKLWSSPIHPCLLLPHYHYVVVLTWWLMLPIPNACFWLMHTMPASRKWKLHPKTGEQNKKFKTVEKKITKNLETMLFMRKLRFETRNWYCFHYLL